MQARANGDRHRQRQQKLKEQVEIRVAAATEQKGILIVFTGNGKREIHGRLWHCHPCGGSR